MPRTSSACERTPFRWRGYCDFHHYAASSNLCGGPRYWAYHMILPWFTFACCKFAAFYARMIRASVLEQLNEDYVRTAHAKGASPWRVLRAHVLPQRILPVVTMLGMDVGVAFAGALFIETAFTLGGIGPAAHPLAVRQRPAGDSRDRAGGQRRGGHLRTWSWTSSTRCSTRGSACTRRSDSVKASRRVARELRTPPRSSSSCRAGDAYVSHSRPRLLVIRAGPGADHGLRELRRPRRGSRSGSRAPRSARRCAGSRRCSSLTNLIRPSCSASSCARIGSTALARARTTAPRSRRRPASRPAATLLLEGLVGELEHAVESTAVPCSAGGRSSGTFQIASSTIARLIFEPPALAVDERDRHLDDAEAGPERAVGRLDLERVARATSIASRSIVSSTRAPVALEAAGQVAHRHAEQHPRVERAAARDEAPHERPSSRSPPPAT